MKTTLLLLSVSLVLVSCGGKNKSGMPEVETTTEAHTPLENPEDDRQVRRDFMRVGRRLLNTYERQIRNLLGDDRLESIKVNFRRDNIEVTDLILTSGGAMIPQRSILQGYRLLIYAGSQYPELSWKNTLAKNDAETDYYVMHELLELGGIDDKGMFRTKRILNREQRPARRR